MTECVVKQHSVSFSDDVLLNTLCGVATCSGRYLKGFWSDLRMVCMCVCVCVGETVGVSLRTWCTVLCNLS